MRASAAGTPDNRFGGDQDHISGKWGLMYIREKGMKNADVPEPREMNLAGTR